MMRQILFRGKRIDNGEWVEGFYVHENTTTLQTKHHVIFSGNNDYSDQTGSDRYESWWVDPSTVGQYTGLKDKNGKRIFEGDIVKWDEREWGSEYSEEVKWDFSLLAARKHDWREWCEIIGNIHDNPELIGGNG